MLWSLLSTWDVQIISGFGSPVMTFGTAPTHSEGAYRSRSALFQEGVLEGTDVWHAGKCTITWRFPAEA
jgi:hypothetical protein